MSDTVAPDLRELLANRENVHLVTRYSRCKHCLRNLEHARFTVNARRWEMNLPPLEAEPDDYLKAAQPAPDVAGLLDRAPEIAKALFKEVPKCTGCDFDHGWDDHVRAVFRDVIAARSTEEDRT